MPRRGSTTVEGVVAMRFPLGRYGDNHVTPDALFDPQDPAARPPADAVDVQFRLPVSLNIMLDGMAQARRDDLVGQWQSVYSEIAEHLARLLQHGAYTPDGSGDAPARLAITPVMHAAVPGFTTARWHLHLYVGATAVSILDGHRGPVSWDGVELTAHGVARVGNLNAVWERTTELWDVRWDEPRPGAEQEIVEPPWHDYIDTLERGVCPGPPGWGRHRIVIADDGIEQRAAEDERIIARERAAGRGLQRAKLLSEYDEYKDIDFGDQARPIPR